MGIQNFIKLSAAVHELSTVTLISDNSKTSIANISEKDQAVDKWKMALSTTTFPTFDKNNLVNFGPLTKKMTLTFDL